MSTVEERIVATRHILRDMRVPQPSGLMRPPGPRGPASLLALMRGKVPPYEFFQTLHNDYQPIAHVQLGREHVYLISDPGLVWEALVTNARTMRKGRGLQLTRPLLGNGILTSEGETHRRNRRLVQPAFHRQRIAAYADDMVAATKDLDNRWTALIGGGEYAEVDLVEQISGLTLDVVGRTLFGADLTGDAAEVGDALNQALSGFTKLATPLASTMSRLPSRTRRTLIDSTNRLDRVVAALIERKRTDVDAGRDDGDVLSMLLQARDEDTGAGLTADELRDETMTLVLAGHETTAMALSWTLRDLTMNPDLRAWLSVEIDALPDATLTMKDLTSLPRTHAVLAESMRLHPPAWVVGRSVTADLELGGWVVPAGSVVLVSQYAMHRDPRYWPTATVYRPSRWLMPDGRFDERAPAVPRGVWFPFGFGGRRCIGEQFAWMEAVIVLATLLRDWEVDVVAPEETVPMAAVTLRPANGLKARITRR